MVTAPHPRPTPTEQTKPKKRIPTGVGTEFSRQGAELRAFVCAEASVSEIRDARQCAGAIKRRILAPSL